MNRAKKGMKAKSPKPLKRAARARKPTKADQAKAERGARDERFATLITGMRQSVIDMQLRSPENFNTSLDELQALYSAK